MEKWQEGFSSFHLPVSPFILSSFSPIRFLWITFIQGTNEGNDFPGLVVGHHHFEWRHLAFAVADLRH
jgi:hypothetical protein